MQQTIKDLFEEPSGLESLTKQDSKAETKDDQPLKPENAATAVNGETMNLNDDMIEQVISISPGTLLVLSFLHFIAVCEPIVKCPLLNVFDVVNCKC